MGIEGLKWLNFQNTSVCAPLDEDFQAWMRMESERRGQDCLPEKFVDEPLGQPVTPDRAALVALYKPPGDRIGHATWNWLTDKPLDTWWGVKTVDGRVTELNLAGVYLEGTGLKASFQRNWAISRIYATVVKGQSHSRRIADRDGATDESEGIGCYCKRDRRRNSCVARRIEKPQAALLGKEPVCRASASGVRESVSIKCVECEPQSWAFGSTPAGVN